MTNIQKQLEINDEKEVFDLDDVYLYTVDDLGDFIKKGLSLREASLEDADDILGNGVEKFMNWFQSQKRSKIH